MGCLQMRKVRIKQENKTVKEGIMCLIGGIFIANWYSIALYALTRELISTPMIMSKLNEAGNMSSVMMVLLFNILGNAFMFLGVFYLIRSAVYKIKQILPVIRREAKS